MPKRFFSNASVFAKIAMSSISVLLLMIILVNITVFFIKENVEKEITAAGHKTLEFYAEGLNSQIKALVDYSFNIMTFDKIQEPLKKMLQPAVSQDKLTASIELLNTLKDNPIYLDSLSALFILDSSLNAYSALNYVSKPEISLALLEKIMQQKGAVIWETLPNDTNHIMLCRVINTIRNEFRYIPIGIMVFAVDLDTLTKSVSLENNFYESSLIITDNTSRIIYTSKNADSFANKLFAVDDMEKRNIVITTNLTAADWTLNLVIPKANLFKGINAIVKTQYVVFFFIFILSIILSLYCAYKVTFPLARLRTEMQKVSKGDFSVDAEYLLEKTGHDEIGEICSNFINTSNQLEMLINENYKSQIIQKNAQLKALQAQINPHFIYNALDCVNWLAKMSSQDKISTIVQALSRLLRSAMSTDKAESTLKEELDLIHDYISIQQLRFGKRLDFEEEIDNNLLHIALPKLILQPIIENSIKYCVEKTNKICTIRLTVSGTDQGYCQIVFTDNGPGILNVPDGELMPEQLNPQGTGIGLNNVQKRLNLLYGKGASLKIFNEKEKGITICILIPSGSENCFSQDKR